MLEVLLMVKIYQLMVVGQLGDKVGIIGFSEANGHPYSFSSIINGYNEKNYQKSNWKLILNYLKKQPEKTLVLTM